MQAAECRKDENAICKETVVTLIRPSRELYCYRIGNMNVREESEYITIIQSAEVKT